MTFKKILVPFDGSLQSGKAFKKAIEMAPKFNSQIMLLTILHKKPKNLSLDKKIIQEILNEDDFSTKTINRLMQIAQDKKVQLDFDVEFDSSIPNGILRYC
ncbi:universal stress protein [Nitrosopumilus sp.]|uniref:universal stress protein n=1 Tax=Nitrosopumilus sp. TaxID=2024843 RepID=UPI002637C9AE|nr:universal stress protein [Nitrosopumilus sp.]